MKYATVISKKINYKWNCLNAITVVLFFFFILIPISCRKVNSEKSTSSLHIEYGSENVDSLLNRIKKDTIALANYLSIAKTNNDYYAQMKVYEYMANYYLENYSFYQAIENHHNYLTIAESVNDPVREIKALNNLGSDYKQVCSINESAEYYYKVLTRIEQLNRSDKEIEVEKAKSLNSLGNIYLNMEQPIEALNYLRQAYAIEKKNDDNLGQAKNLANIGLAYEKMQKYDSARYYYDKSMNFNILSNSISGMAICFLRIGNLEMKQKNYESALINLDTAYKTLQDTSDDVNRANACFALGEINTILNRYSEAEKYLNEGVAVAKITKMPYFLENAYRLLATLHKKEGKISLAVDEFIVSNFYAETSKNERRTNQLLEVRMQYERAQDKKKIETITEQFAFAGKKKDNFINLILIVLAVLIFCIVILFHLNRRKKYKNESSLKFEKLKSTFYMNMSHEFKTPVNIIFGLAETLKKNIEEGNLPRNLINLDIISRQSENLLFLIEEVFSMSKLQIHNKPTKWINGDIIPYMRYLHECFEFFSQTKKITYTFKSSQEKLIMDYAPDYMRIIINNILNNSIKYCSENDKIEFSVEEDTVNRECIIKIIDSGLGISQEDLPYIFDTFFQGQSDLSDNMGSGIGLALTKQLVEKLHGRIEVKSVPQKQTEFIVTLPVTHNADTMLEEIKQTALSYSENSFNHEIEIEESGELPENPSILIVEDNQDMIYYISTVLQNKYNVLSAINGKEALQIAKDKMPDLILSDVVMPVFDGFQLCKELKNSDITNHIPLILLTAKTQTVERVRGFKCGADAFLTKPFIEEELLAVIDQLLASRKQIREKYAQLIVANSDGWTMENMEKDANFEFLQRVTDVIYREIEADSLFSILASEMALSQSQLNRKIKAISGLTTTNYILMIRLNRAKKILAKSQKPIGDIAMECGFNDFAYFSRSFKKEFGLTPTAFQRIPHSTK